MRQAYTVSAHRCAEDQPPIGFDFDDEELEEAAKEIGPMCDKQRKRSFSWYYMLGAAVHDHYCRVREERERRSTSMYGERFYLRLAEQLNRPDITDALLSECAALARNISREEYIELSQHPELSTTHARMLARIEIAEDREQFKAMIINQQLTTKELRCAMLEFYGYRRKPGGGRKPKIYKQVAASLTHMTAQCEKFCTLNNGWLGDDYNVSAAIAEMPGSQLNEQLLSKLKGARNHCSNVAATASADVEQLDDLITRVEGRMVAQAEVNAQVAAAEEAFSEEEQSSFAERRVRSVRTSSNRRTKQDRRIGREAHTL